MSSIVDAMKSELERLEGENAKWNAEYEAAQAEMTRRLAPYSSHWGEIDRLKQALKILEAE